MTVFPILSDPTRGTPSCTVSMDTTWLSVLEQVGDRQTQIDTDRHRQTDRQRHRQTDRDRLMIIILDEGKTLAQLCCTLLSTNSGFSISISLYKGTV